MPKLLLVNEAPMPSKLTAAQLEERRKYEEFVHKVLDSGKIGQLELEKEDSLANIRMKLSHAARRTGAKLDMWSVDHDIYFRAKTAADAN